MTQDTILWIERNEAMLGHPVDSASKMIAASSRVMPLPPFSSRT